MLALCFCSFPFPLAGWTGAGPIFHHTYVISNWSLGDGEARKEKELFKLFPFCQDLFVIPSKPDQQHIDENSTEGEFLWNPRGNLGVVS